MSILWNDRIQNCRCLTDKHWELLLKADPSKKQIVKYIENGYVFDLFIGDELIGIIVLTPLAAERIEIMNLSINEEWQGKGFAKALIEYACSFSRANGYRIIEIGTGNSSINQLALYQKCGFRIMGIDLDYFCRNYEEPIYENGMLCRDMLRLERKLNETYS